DPIVTAARQCVSIVATPGAGSGEEPTVAIARLHREARHREAFVVCELHRGAARRRAFECTTAACAGNEPVAARRHMRFLLQSRRLDAMAVCKTFGVDLSVR
nr:hypothetical protein [Myxococcota bacterium]